MFDAAKRIIDIVGENDLWVIGQTPAYLGLWLSR